MGVQLTHADSNGTTTFTYDALNRLTQAAHPGTFGTWAWQYNQVGNRTRQDAPPGAVLPGYGSVPQVTTYTYDANNRLTAANSTTYSYDNNGNLTGISTGQSFTWDVFNRLTQATSAGGTATYTYNGDGLKLRRVGPDGTTNYYHDGIRPIWETDAAGAMKAQYDRDIFGNLLSRLEPGSVRRYYHHDGLGSTTALTDSTGAVAGTLLYDAWGNVRTSSGTGYGRYRYTGAERDPTSGLYHMGARFYDPVIGRWLSEDPVKQAFNPRALNFYAYVYDNPLRYTDLTGRLPDPLNKQDFELYLPSADQERFEQALTGRGGFDSDILLALLQAARNGSSIPTREDVLRMYRTAVIERLAAAGFLGQAALRARQGDIPGALKALERASVALALHIASASTAVEFDRRYYNGEVFNSLTPFEQWMLYPFRP